MLTGQLVAWLSAFAAVAGSGGPAPAPVEPAGPAVASLTARQKAALLVVSGLPARPGVGGVIVFAATREIGRPHRALVFTDQEGGDVERYPWLPPDRAASAYRAAAAAREQGELTGRALRAVGVHVDLAPVLDWRDGPLGSRHFRSPELAIAFARGLAAGGAGACVKHFPGLGSTAASTDAAVVRGVVRGFELGGFRDAIRAGVACVMVSHAIYPRFGQRHASLEPATYRLLRRLGFEGVAITDSLSPLGPGAPRWARLAVRAGADLVLVQDPQDTADVIHALVPLARAGELDAQVARVLAYRASLGLAPVP